MNTETPRWRVNDTVAYDVMRETATALQAQLLELARTDNDAAVETTRAEAAAIRDDVFAVDGYDRAAIDAQTKRFTARLAELTTDTT